MADVAAMNMRVSDSMVEHIGLIPFQQMRRTISRRIHELLPGERIYWVVSRTNLRTYELMGLASEDHDRVRKLAMKARTTRKTWHGYKTDWDWLMDNP